jgi:hypothetical protein
VGRFGAAIHQFHTILPLMYRYSPNNRRTAAVGDRVVEVEGPYALATLHVTGLEATRYLHKTRRKGNGTAAAHSFVVAARAERALHRAQGVPIIAGSDCHDVVEDGGLVVTGYDQSLELFASRFGSPLAALVSEVTDSITKSDGPKKAAAFLEQPHLRFPEEIYNVGQFEELKAVATDPEVPYTIAGVVIKLADTGTTQDEGIRDPDMLTGVWRHSGARISWDQYGKGNIVRPLIERLAVELELSETDPYYFRKPGALPRELVPRMKELLGWSLIVTDHYMVQNLTILCDEYGLDEPARRDFLARFLDGEIDREQFRAYLDERLDDRRLAPKVRERGLAASYHVISRGEVERRLSKLLDYRDSALWRAQLRRRLGLSSPSQKSMDDVVRLYDLRMKLPARIS